MCVSKNVFLASVFGTPDIRFEIRPSPLSPASPLHLDNIRPFFFHPLFFSHTDRAFFSLARAARFLDDAFPRGVALRKRITIESIRQGTGTESSVVMLISVQKMGKRGEKA